ncbi:MAG TPA: cupin domain-containing protein [Mycobacteriales bacterium]|nr:cupin domain-containing protein [Mycobacteriales bacterium]
MHVIRTRPESALGPAEWFTGTAWIDRIAVASAPSRLVANSVHFTPSARTAWHQHAYGQILHITEGVGRVQHRSGPVVEVRAGDTVVTLPGEWHWHGAAPHHFMTHLGMQEADDNGNAAEWGAHVTDAEYLAAPVDVVEG